MNRLATIGVGMAVFGHEALLQPTLPSHRHPSGFIAAPDTKAAPRADTKLHESSAGDLNDLWRAEELRHKQDSKASQGTCTTFDEHKINPHIGH